MSIYKKTGSLSAAEAAQESLLRLAIESDLYCADEVTIEAEKLRHFYALFYDRIRNITVQRGDDQIVSADLARLLVFCRITALDYDSVKLLIKLIEVPNEAMHIAVLAGATRLTTLLLDHGGCDVNATDEEGNTALHIAVRGCQVKIVQSLLDKGSDPKVTDSVGRTTLYPAARSGTPDPTEIVLSCGLEVDAPDFKGTTPLIIARSDSSNCVPIAPQLLESGANVSAFGDDDGTPLTRASRFENIEMVQLLIARGANIESRDSFGRTALHMALERTAGTEKDIISILNEVQIDTEATDYDRRSALGVALKRGNLAVARQLLEHGADVEAEL